ncbi:MAG: ABC transporter ATP-binding protein [Spirochaetales bacterium]|nr:ABC transporter ATP-binding protein [Spirochaetales bacterium]
MSEQEILLSVRNLRTLIKTANGTFSAVDGVNFDLEKGKALGIVGESGSGKTMLSMSILGLLPQTARISEGEVFLNGEDLRTLSKKEYKKIRGKKIGTIFQEPLTSFDPLYTIGDQIAESLKHHCGLKRSEARIKVIELLETVGIPRPESVYDEFPFQLSGGMRQRAMIAMALAPSPEIIIADEPTTALDVTIQAQILELLKDLQKERNVTVLFVSHDLGVIAEIVDEVMVVYGGQVMEHTDVNNLFYNPAHPYTKALLKARPTLTTEGKRLRAIAGQVPSLEARPSGCPFHPRCEQATEKCSKKAPPMTVLENSIRVACWLYCHENEKSGEQPNV